jgi:hypothetical protein
MTVGATSALAQERPENLSPAPGVTVATDNPEITVVRHPRYDRDLRWRHYQNRYYPRYDTYYNDPRHDWRGVPRHYGYYAPPYPGYYYQDPRAFGFQYYGPRGGFSFGF